MKIVFNENKRWIIVALIYTAAVILTCATHEVWRDEVLPVSIIAEHKNLPEIYLATHNFGHPLLWHTLLYAGYSVFSHPVILKILAVFLSVVGAVVFLRFSPFQWYQKILFLFGFFPIYQYSAFSRSYALYMPLFFILAAIFKDRAQKILWFCLILFLLAQTHVHSLIFVLVVTLMLLVEKAQDFKRKTPGKNHRWWIAGMAIVFLGVALSIVSMKTDQSSIVFDSSQINLGKIVKQLSAAIIHPEGAFARVFGFDALRINALIIFFMYLFLFPKPKIFFIFSASVIAFSIFSGLIYHFNFYHQGILIILIVFSFWVERHESVFFSLSNPRIRQLMRIRDYAGNILLLVVLLTQCRMAYTAVKNDLFNDYSASEPFAKLVRETPQLHNAIIMSERGGYVETIPYYLDHDIYIYREETFRRYRKLTTSAKKEATLEELLQSARAVSLRENRPVLILLDRKISFNGPFEIKYSYGVIFRYTQESFAEFEKNTIKLAEYAEAISDERFNVYLLKPSP
jgi:hypothetical protein